MPDQPDAPRRPKKQKPPMEGLIAREAALDVLRLIRKGFPLDDAMKHSEGFCALEGPDRGFARTLVMTVLRRRNSLDEIYGEFLDRPLAASQHETRSILRIAAAQICLLGTPPHAAAMTSVELAKGRRDSAGFAKLINALCRRMTELPAEKVAELPPRTDTPGWLWRQLERAYGAKTARAIAEVHRGEPPLDITVKDLATRDAWAEKLGGEPIGPASLRLTTSGRIEDFEGYTEGDWWVQDLAATLPVMLAGDVAGKRVIDLCAAPGGKTLQLAAAGASVTAVDISGRRMERLDENLARTKLQARRVVSDALDYLPETPGDVVLLDAPCTATGTVRRHPDLLWSKKEEDSRALAVMQALWGDLA